MTSGELRGLARVHRAIHAHRTFVLYGTSEGVTKSWQTRKRGEPGEREAHAAIVDKFRNGLEKVDDYGSTKFILPDGTRLGHYNDDHWTAANDLGVELYEAMDAGILRYAGSGAAEIGAPITKAQAQHLVDAYYESGEKNPIQLDVFNKRVLDWKSFGGLQRPHASAIFNWVKSVFERPPDDENNKTLSEAGMTILTLRERAQVHRAIYLSRTFALAGTAEGAAKGWESRKKGGGAAVAVPKRPVPAPVVRQALTGTIGAMPAAERAALDAGYQSAKKKGFTGGQDEFLAEQAALYEHAPEGDPRFETWLSGETLDRLKADAGAKGLVNVLAANQKVPVATPAAPAAPTPEAQPEAQPAPVAVVRPAQTIAQSRVPVTQAWANALAKGKQGLAGVKQRGDRLTGEQARAQARAQKIATAKSSRDLRQLADVHRTIHANRMIALDGTSEGAEKGWEDRKDGVGSSTSSTSSATAKIVKPIVVAQPKKKKVTIVKPIAV